MHVSFFRSNRVVALLALPFFLFAAACTRSDADIRANVETKLATDPETATGHFTVVVDRGIVNLSGDAMSRAGITRAGDITKEIRGVTQVVNEVTLSDASIIAAVKQAIAADAVVGRIPLEVESNDGLVKLRSDQTNKDERTRLVDITSHVDGVTKVEDWMR